MSYRRNYEIDTRSPDFLWRILAGVAKEAASQHDYNSALQYFQHSLLAAQEAFGPDDLRVGIIFLDCAEMSCAKSDLKQARDYLSRARKIFDRYSRKQAKKATGH